MAWGRAGWLLLKLRNIKITSCYVREFTLNTLLETTATCIETIIRQTNKTDAPQANFFKITIIITEVGSRIEWYQTPH